MRLLRILSVMLAVLLLAAAATAWLLPGRLDSARFREPLQLLAGRMLGVPARIAGPIRLSLLPAPVLEAGGLDVTAAGGARLVAQGLRLRVALAPLLTGRIEARSLLLYRPVLTLPGPLDPRVLLLHRAAWLGTAALRVTDGALIAGMLRLQGVDGAVDTDPLTGDLRAAGNEGGWRFALQLSRPGGDGAAALALTLDGQQSRRGSVLAFSGQVAADGTIQGHGTARGPDLSRLLPTPALPFAAEGRVSFAAGLAEADDLALTLGDTPASGAVALRTQPAPRLDLALTTSRLALDPWLASLRRTVAAPSTALPIGVDLSAEAATLGGGTLRGLRTGFDLTGGTLRLREFRATAPGEAALGVLGQAQAGRFQGDVTLDAPDWPTTRRWLLAVLPQGLPLPTATALRLAAHAALDQGRLALSDIDGRLDDMAVGGALLWQPPVADAPAALVARLALVGPVLDGLNAAMLPGTDLDLTLQVRRAVWPRLTLPRLTLPRLSLSAARQNAAWTLRDLAVDGPGMAFAAHGRLSAGGRLDDGQASLDLERPAAWTDRLAPVMRNWPPLNHKLHLAVQASGSPEALSMSLDGRLGDSALSASPVVDLRHGVWHGPLRLRDPSARALLQASGLLARAGWPNDLGWLGEGSLTLAADASGDADSLTLDRLSLAAGALHLGGRLRLGWSGAPSLDGSLQATTLPLPPWQALAQAWLGAGTPSGTARIAVQADRAVLPGLPALTPFSASLALAGGRLALDHVKAGVAGGTIEASGAIDLAASPPRLVTAASFAGVSLSGGLAGTPVDVTAGRISGQLDVSAAGYSAAALRASLQGEAAFRVDDGTLQGVSLAALPPTLPEAPVAAALQGGSTPFDRLDLELRLQQGVASIAAGRIGLASGLILLSGSDDLARKSVDLRLDFQPRAVATSALDPGLAPPAIGLRLVGANGAVQRIPELAAIARWRAASQEP